MCRQLVILGVLAMVLWQAAAQPGPVLTFTEVSASNCIDTGFNYCGYDDYWYQSGLACPSGGLGTDFVAVATAEGLCEWSLDFWADEEEAFPVGGDPKVLQLGVVSFNCRLPASCGAGAGGERLSLIGRGNLYEFYSYVTATPSAPSLGPACFYNLARRVAVPDNSTSAFSRLMHDAWHPDDLDEKMEYLEGRVGARGGKRPDGGDKKGGLGASLYYRPLLKKVETARRHQEAEKAAREAGKKVAAAATPKEQQSTALNYKRDYYYHDDKHVSHTFYPAYVDVGSGTFTITSGDTVYENGSFQMVFDYGEAGPPVTGPVDGQVFTPYQLDLWLNKGKHDGYYEEKDEYKGGYKPPGY